MCYKLSKKVKRAKLFMDCLKCFIKCGNTKSKKFQLTAALPNPDQMQSKQSFMEGNRPAAFILSLVSVAFAGGCHAVDCVPVIV